MKEKEILSIIKKCRGGVLKKDMINYIKILGVTQGWFVPICVGVRRYFYVLDDLSTLKSKYKDSKYEHILKYIEEAYSETYLDGNIFYR